MKRFIFLMLMGLSFDSFAHDDGGVLGAEVSSVDYYAIDCSVDSDRMYFRISAPNVKPLVSAQVSKGNFATNIIATRGGVSMIEGGGIYRVTVNKNGTGEVGYSFEFHCENNGEHTETTIVKR
jgi:hypothetical protein